MGILDVLFQRAPAAIASGLKGQREGREYQDKIKREAMMDSLANRRADETERRNDMTDEVNRLRATIAQQVANQGDPYNRAVGGEGGRIDARVGRGLPGDRVTPESGTVINEVGGQQLVGSRTGKPIATFGARPQPPEPSVVIQTPDAQHLVGARTGRTIKDYTPKPAVGAGKVSALTERARGFIENAESGYEQFNSAIQQGGPISAAEMKNVMAALGQSGGAMKDFIAIARASSLSDRAIQAGVGAMELSRGHLGAVGRSNPLAVVQDAQVFLMDKTGKQALATIHGTRRMAGYDPETGKPVAASSTPTGAKSKADRWQELRDSGLSAEEATAQVNREFPE